MKADELSAYAGRWVATIGQRVVAQGGTPSQALKAAKAACFKETPQVVYVASTQPILFPEILTQISSILPPDLPVFLVGGAVRDALLQKESHDLDFVTVRDSLAAGRKVANALEGAFFILDDQRQTARVVLKDKHGARQTLDFALMRGSSIEADLLDRDFTVNAMAVDIRSPHALLDPTGGTADLLAKKLRACSPQAMRNDPIRVMRGVRLAAAYSFHIHLETRHNMRQAAAGLSEISPERLRDELWRILSGVQPGTVLRALDLLGALHYITPEIEALKGVSQSFPHTEDVYQHTLNTLHQMEKLLGFLSSTPHPDESGNLWLGLLSAKLGRYRPYFQPYLQTQLNPDRSFRGMLLLAALYHDAGKPATREVEAAGRVRFFSHEVTGEKLATQRGRALALSNVEIERIATVVRHHMRPMLLANQAKEPSARAIYRFFRDCGEAGVDICLLSLADTLSTYGTSLDQNTWMQHLNVVRKLLEAWWETPQKSVLPPALLNGDQIMAELNLPPGPVIGELIELLREAQVCGEIRDRQQAIDYLHSWSKNQSKPAANDG